MSTAKKGALVEDERDWLFLVSQKYLLLLTVIVHQLRKEGLVKRPYLHLQLDNLSL